MRLLRSMGKNWKQEFAYFTDMKRWCPSPNRKIIFDLLCNIATIYTCSLYDYNNVDGL